LIFFFTVYCLFSQPSPLYTLLVLIRICSFFHYLQTFGSFLGNQLLCLGDRTNLYTTFYDPSHNLSTKRNKNDLASTSSTENAYSIPMLYSRTANFLQSLRTRVLLHRLLVAQLLKELALFHGT